MKRWQALGYLGISAQNIDEWSDFAVRELGLQLVDRGVSCRAFRMDDRRQQVIVDKERPDAERFFGWEVADAASFDARRLDRGFLRRDFFGRHRHPHRWRSSDTNNDP